ncbi:MAG: helix-hairpin-helix domain-containing protein [Actinomycetota bacterium]|nr:helix-hairpin-helix domain-containing protein [Actinomycetota bacterium]
MGRYKPQVVVSVLVVAVLLGGAYYSSRASEATPRVVYSTALDEAVAEAQAPLLLNVNTAEAEDLEDLPEVGPSTAQSIVEYRESNGSFRSLDELASVRKYENGGLSFRALLTQDGAERLELTKA